MFVLVLCNANGVGCVSVQLWVAVHPEASVTTTLYIPAGIPDNVAVVDPLLHK